MIPVPAFVGGGIAEEAKDVGTGHAYRLRDEDLLDGMMAATLGSSHARRDEAVALRVAVDEALSDLPTEFVVALRAARREGPARFRSRDSERYKLTATFRSDLRYVHVEVAYKGCSFALRIEPAGRRYRGSVVAMDSPLDVATHALRLLSRDWRAYHEEIRESKPQVNDSGPMKAESVEDV